MSKPQTAPPPAHLDDQARAKWAEAYPLVADRAEPDQGTLDALAAYCMAYSRWADAESNISQIGGTVVKSPAGFAIPNPYLAVAAAAQRQMRQWGAELGLTPAARKKVKPRADTPAPSEPSSLFDELLHPRAPTDKTAGRN